MGHALRLRDLWVVLGCALTYLGWVGPLVNRPILADETLIVANATEPVNPGPLSTGHPPLHVDTMRMAGRIFGWRLHDFHWYGVGCMLVGLVLVVATAGRLHPHAGPLAALLWTTHPLAIQGSVVVDIDNTILPVCLSAWVLLWLSRPWPWRRVDAWWMGLAFFVCLWAKVTTSLILPLAVLGYGIGRGQWRQGARAALAMTAIGSLVFAVAWWWYTWRYAFPALRIWEHLTSKFELGLGGDWLPGPVEWLNRFVRIALWFNPILLAMGGLIGWWLWRRRMVLGPPQAAILWWIIGLVGIGYLAIRGLHFGFAKYHFPILPLLIALVSAGCLHAGFPTTRRHWAWLVLGAAVIAAYVALACGDLLYLVNYRLRQALLFTPQERLGLLGQLLARGTALLLPWVVGAFWLARKPLASGVRSWLLAGLVTLIGSNLATDLWQHTTRYSTTYNYGRSVPEMRRLIDWLSTYRSRYPTGYWLAPEDVMFYLGLTYTGGYGTWWKPPFWNSPEVVAEGLGDPQTHGLVVSPTYHSAWTHQQVFANPTVRSRLEDEYRPYRLGEYTIWVRRARQVPPGVS